MVGPIPPIRIVEGESVHFEQFIFSIGGPHCEVSFISLMERMSETLPSDPLWLCETLFFFYH